MNAEQVNAVGGWCELVGVAFLVRDLMSLARYRGKLQESTAWLKARLAKVAARATAWWQRLRQWLRRRPSPAVEATTIAAKVTIGAHDAMGSTGRMPRPFTPRPGQSLEDQIDELGFLVNRLREEVIKEPQERKQAIAADREARREEIRAEAEERERRIAEVQRDVEKLRDVTTGDLGLKVESVVFLALGVVCTTWPELVAGWLPEWPPFRIAMSFLVGYLLLRTYWA